MRAIVREVTYLAGVAVASSAAVYLALRVIGGANSPLVSAAAREGRRSFVDHVSGYIAFLGDFVTGDWGNSRVSGFPVVELAGYHGRNSLVLGLSALVLVFALGVPLGVTAARRRGSSADSAITSVATIGLGVPQFWAALLLVWLFGPTLGLLPAAGCCSPRHLILPALVLSLEGVALTVRLTRAVVTEVLEREFVTTLRALGLDGWRTMAKHVLRNALIPLVSVFGLRVGQIVGGSVIVEIVFGWPGLGFVLVDAVFKRDFPVAQAFSMILVLAVIVANRAADRGHEWADPRLRRGGAR